MLKDDEPKELSFGHPKDALLGVEFFFEFLEVGECSLQVVDQLVSLL